jgi:hypothetical protein
MTRLQRKRLFKIIQGGKQDEPTLIDLAFAPCWYWLQVLANISARQIGPDRTP